MCRNHGVNGENQSIRKPNFQYMFKDLMKPTFWLILTIMILGNVTHSYWIRLQTHS